MKYVIVFRLRKSCATVNWSKTNTVAIAFDSRKRERNLSYLVNFYSLKTGKLRTILSVFLLCYFKYLFIFFQNLVVYYARDDIKVFEALSCRHNSKKVGKHRKIKKSMQANLGNGRDPLKKFVDGSPM